MIKSTLKTIAATSLLALSSLSFAADIDMNADANDLAIKGYDPVAYFTAGMPKMGTADYTATYKGAIYRFSSEKNRDKFKANPAKFAPQYGGYCAFGVSKEKKFDTDPTAWKIVDGKLYLNLNAAVQKRWLSDVPGLVADADENWGSIKNTAADDL
ncbi:YHS domain-containing protein [Endozoicomonas sp. G2_1]|uniref:YHS domain-containing (seleno)protein n=1 Tax=Endozoicomonas sp. G2_1 TaxID=2821091 RepID=UPI001ADCC607|nr:YHS domain-containing (seleno)protein [Endozoicomonas sp. G2_1]MBO9490190.1 YHS domain-containing protein [Endozoicomonas sp. G2_1]